MKKQIELNTNHAMVDTFIQLSCKALAHSFFLVAEGNILKHLNEKFMVERQLGIIACGLSLKYGKYTAIASALLLAKKISKYP